MMKGTPGGILSVFSGAVRYATLAIGRGDYSRFTIGGPARKSGGLFSFPKREIQLSCRENLFRMTAHHSPSATPCPRFRPPMFTSVRICFSIPAGLGLTMLSAPPVHAAAAGALTNWQTALHVFLQAGAKLGE